MNRVCCLALFRCDTEETPLSYFLYYHESNYHPPTAPTQHKGMEVHVTCVLSGNVHIVEVEEGATVLDVRERVGEVLQLGALPQLWQQGGEGRVLLGGDGDAVSGTGLCSGDTLLAEVRTEVPHIEDVSASWKSPQYLGDCKKRIVSLSPGGRYCLYFNNSVGGELIQTNLVTDTSTTVARLAPHKVATAVAMISEQHFAYLTDTSVHIMSTESTEEQVSFTPALDCCGKLLSMTGAPERVVVGCQCSVRVFSLEGVCLARAEVPACHVTVSPCARWVACLNTGLQLLDLETLSLVKVFTVPVQSGSRVLQCAPAFSPCSGLVALSHGTVVCICSVEDEQIRHRFSGHDVTLSHISFSMCGGYVLSCDGDRRLRRWSLATGICDIMHNANYGIFWFAVSRSMKTVVYADVNELFVKTLAFPRRIPTPPAPPPPSASQTQQRRRPQSQSRDKGCQCC